MKPFQTDAAPIKLLATVRWPVGGIRTYLKYVYLRLDPTLFDITVVATRVGGMPDVLEDGAGGVLVPPENVDALADGIASVVDNPEASRVRADTAWQRARMRYGVESMARRYIDVYSHLLADARAKHETVSD